MDDSLLPTEATAGDVTYPPGGAFGPRVQRNLQLVILHTGRMTVWVDGAPRTAHAGTVAVLFPGHEERFAFAPVCETRHSWLHAHIPHLGDDVRERMARLFWPLPLSPTMAALTHAMLALRSSLLPTAPLIGRALAMEMLWRYIGEGELLANKAAVSAHPALVQAQEFIHTHLDQPLTLDLIARAAALSPAHLIRLFRVEHNATPMAYLWARRVALGVELLRETGLPVGVIALRCGFQTSYHFSRRVRQATGLAPSEVRRRAWRVSSE